MKIIMHRRQNSQVGKLWNCVGCEIAIFFQPLCDLKVACHYCTIKFISLCVQVINTCYGIYSFGSNRFSFVTNPFLFQTVDQPIPSADGNVHNRCSFQCLFSWFPKCFCSETFFKSLRICLSLRFRFNFSWWNCHHVSAS